MAQQGDVERRMAGGIGSKRRRRGSGDPPPRLCRARHRLRIDPQHQCQDTRSRRRHRKPPRGRQIEQRRFSPRFDHDRADLSAFDDVRPRAKDRERIGRIDQNEAVRVKS